MKPFILKSLWKKCWKKTDKKSHYNLSEEKSFEHLKVRKNIIFQWLHMKGSWDWAHPSRGQACLDFRGFLSQLHSVWVCKVNLIFNFRIYLMEITLYWNLPSRDELFYVIFLSLFLHDFPLPPDLKDLKAILSQFWQFVANYVC